MAGVHAMQDMVAEIKRLDDKLKALPPSPRAIITHHAVPYGRCFKQWMANGTLIVWANRGEVEDMPRRRAEAPPDGVPVFGIPVHNA